MNVEGIEASLVKRGFVLLDEGSYSQIWGHNQRDYVYKVNCLEPDPAWFAYANMCKRKHSDNPFAPRIHWIRATDWGSVAKVEACDRTIHNSPYSDMTKLYHLADRAVWGRDSVLFELEESHPELAALIHDIRELDRSGEGVIDFHSNNVMVKGHRMVIVDPLA